MTGPLRRQGESHVPGGLGMSRAGHQVRAVSLVVETLPDGAVRVSSPQARGWAGVARNPGELARVVASAFTEAQVAAYAAWKGELYDLDELTDVDPGDPTTDLPVPPKRRNRMVRSDAQHPADWRRTEDGRWRSPGGRYYREETQLVQRVMANRRALGIADPPA
jgi:hypothetical protein